MMIFLESTVMGITLIIVESQFLSYCFTRECFDPAYPIILLSRVELNLHIFLHAVMSQVAIIVQIIAITANPLYLSCLLY